MDKNKKTQPLRSCVVCRKRNAKNLLQRYVWDKARADIISDQQQILTGRGAYCCLDGICRERFIGRKQSWKKAFRLN